MKKNQTAEEEPKVVAAYVQPGKDVTPENMETLREEQKRAEDQARIDAIKQLNRNKVAKIMGATYFIREWTHPCLLIEELHRQVSVAEFYPEFNVAIDKFFHFDAWEAKLTEQKKKALNAAGFKYAALTPDKDWADVAIELDEQEVKKA